MTAFGTATNWLSSTPVSIRVSLAPVARMVTPGPVSQPGAEPIVPILRSGWRTASLEYAAKLDQEAKLNSLVTVHGDQGLQLQVGCFGDIRRAQLVGDSIEGNRVHSLVIDSASFAANWHAASGSGSVALRAGDTERIVSRLRRAQSLSVRFGSPRSSLVAFDLTGMFETPVQPNIDHCGNYTEPSWKPVAAVQSDTSPSDASYFVHYPEWNDFQRDTGVQVNDIGGATGPDGVPTTLSLRCSQLGRTFQLGNLPSGDGLYAVRSRIDGGEWLSEGWRVYTTESGWIYAPFEADYEQLRDGALVEYEIPLDPVVRLSFDLSSLFSTSVQPNVDNCNVDPWPQTPTYVPLTGVRGSVSERVSYRAAPFTIGTISTSVESSIAAPGAQFGEAKLTVSCEGSSRLIVQIGNLESGELGLTDLTFGIGQRAAETSPWNVGTSTNSRRTVYFFRSQDPQKVIAQLQQASVVTVEIPSLGFGPVSFDIQGMFDTPIQQNLDECGYYKPGETRRLPRQYRSCVTSPGDTASDGGETTDVATVSSGGWIAEAITLVAEAYHAGDGVWPNFDPTVQQTVLAHRDAGQITELLTIGVVAPDRLGAATPLATFGTPFCSLAHVVEMNQKTLAILDEIPTFNFQVDFGHMANGLYVMIVDLEEDSYNPFADHKRGWREFVMHELFHHYQGGDWAYVPGRDFKTYVYDSGNLELAALEDRALRAAVTARDPEVRLRAASHFVAIRTKRTERVARVAHDEGQERLEGTARYLERRLGFRYAEDGSFQLATDPQEFLGDGRLADERVRYYYAFRRFYETGAAIIRLLDLFEIEDYAPRIEAGRSPAQVLGEYLDLGQNEIDSLVGEARATYDPDGELPVLAARLAAAAAKEDWDGPGG